MGSATSVGGSSGRSRRGDSPLGVLFLCVANSARSQMAEAIARRLGGDALRVQSAGSRPAYVHPVALDVLAERGIDASSQWSKSVREIDPTTVDIVITLCAAEECPLFLGEAERLHWPLPDPIAQDLATTVELFRRVRDEIEAHFAAWMAERGIPGAAASPASSAAEEPLPEQPSPEQPSPEEPSPERSSPDPSSGGGAS